jgi:hypothetical protein
LRDALASALAEERTIALEDRELLWAMSRELMFGLGFISVHCPVCARTFLPEECQVRGWNTGSGLVACGGRSVLCPSGHVLYSMTEWNS